MKKRDHLLGICASSRIQYDHRYKITKKWADVMIHRTYPQHKSKIKVLAITLSFTIGTLTLTGCSHFQHGGHSHHSVDTVHSHHTLQKNGDQKWLMDTHTRDTLAAMQETIQQTKPETMSVDQRISMGQSLDQSLDKLIKGCTMQGASHDALHLYLSELMPAISALKSNGGLQEASLVEDLLLKYQTYFE